MIATTVSRRACAGSLVTFLLAAGLASCGSVTRDDAESRPVSMQPAPRVFERLSRIQRHNFALLRTQPEGLPARFRRLASIPKVVINPALAQRIPVTALGNHWLVPGVGHLCIVSDVPKTPGALIICARTQQAITQGFGSISFPPAKQAPAGMPMRLLVGIAPDDARTALVHTKGSVATVPVVNGVFVLRDSVLAPSDFIELRRIRGT
jgi:hypothetical protein